MTRAAAGLLFSAFLAAGAQHGEHGAKKAEAHGTAEHGNPHEIWWKWANFALLAAGLGYLIAKNAGPFFIGRTAGIRKGIEESERARADAEARMKAMDARLANLSTEIAALKTTAAQEQTAAAERLRTEVATEIEKIQAHAAREIEAAAKAARAELKRHAGALAIQLAEQKIRDRISPETQEALVRSFADGLPGRTP
jgi:F0F1-type ATP synthase membrane subunit b/b'